MTDPIDRPDFHPNLARPANPIRIAKIRDLGELHKAKLAEAGTVYEELRKEVRAAKDAGHSFPQLADAAGVSISSIQRMVE